MSKRRRKHWGWGYEDEQPAPARPYAATAWRRALSGAPYLRDTLVAMEVLVESFEAAITWNRLAGPLAAVREATAANQGL